MPDEITTLKYSYIRLDEKLISIKKTVEKSQKSIDEMVLTLTDLKVVQNRLNETEKKVSTLFNKYDAMNIRIDKFMQKTIIAFIVATLSLGGTVIAELIHHIYP